MTVGSNQGRSVALEISRIQNDNDQKEAEVITGNMGDEKQAGEISTVTVGGWLKCQIGGVEVSAAFRPFLSDRVLYTTPPDTTEVDSVAIVEHTNDGVDFVESGLRFRYRSLLPSIVSAYPISGPRAG
eukprot:868038_1